MILEQNILAEGNCYPGDLLKSILNLSQEDWQMANFDREQLLKLLKDKLDIIETIEDRDDKIPLEFELENIEFELSPLFHQRSG